MQLPYCLAAAVFLAGCGSKPMYQDEAFSAHTQHSKRVRGSGEVVCWSVKRAFLTQGYMLDRSSDSGVVAGTKDVQPDDETQESVRLQATCADNGDGTSTVFASAAHEVSKLQRTRQSMSAGVSVATITIPTGTEKSLRLLRRETIKDKAFYERFYTLVQQFVAEEDRASASTGRTRR